MPVTRHVAFRQRCSLSDVCDSHLWWLMQTEANRDASRGCFSMKVVWTMVTMARSLRRAMPIVVLLPASHGFVTLIGALPEPNLVPTLQWVFSYVFDKLRIVESPSVSEGGGHCSTTPRCSFFSGTATSSTTWTWWLRRKLIAPSAARLKRKVTYEVRSIHSPYAALGISTRWHE